MRRRWLVSVRMAVLAGLAALVAALAAGCGESHGGSAGGRAAGAPAPAAVVGNRSLATVAPPGWRSDLAAARARGFALLAATVGPRHDGIAEQIVVTRVRARRTKPGALGRTLVAGARRNHATVTAKPRSLTVAGAPAVALDTARVDHGRRLAIRTVDALHGGWLYIVTGVAPGGEAAGTDHALGFELAHWSWR